MIKKLFSTVLISLLCCGLIFSGSVSAMKYVVEGYSTSIGVPQGTEGTTIKRCNDCETMEIYSYQNGCETQTINDVSYIVCSHSYDTEGPHTVYFDGKNKTFFNLYLNGAHIKNIIDFGDINKITTLYLGDNPRIILENNIFSDKITTISLTHNNFTGIDDNIRNRRNIYDIILSPNITYTHPGTTKAIDLSDNSIGFIGITKVGGNDTLNCGERNNRCEFYNKTDYNFEWFGYSSNNACVTDGKLVYGYEIAEGSNSIITQNYNPDNYENGKIAKVTVSDALKPGNYTFTAKSMHCGLLSGSTDFKVTYDVGIDIRTPSQDQEIDNINDAVFQRRKTGQYPDQFLSGYRYELEYNNNRISQGITSETSFSIPADLIQQHGDGNYTLFVYLLDSDGNSVYSDGQGISDGSSNGNQVYDTAAYTINTTPSSDIKVTITAPKGTVTSSSTVFSREGQVSQPNSLGQALSEYIITGYDRKLYKGNNTDPISSGNVSTTDTTYNMNYNGLTNGKYTLGVVMNYCQQSGCYATIETYTYFEVQLSTGDAKITITKPTTGTLTSKIQEFIRSGDAGKNYTVSGYYYKLENTSTNQIVSQNTGSSLKSFTENNLTNGNYKLTVVMYIKDGANNVKTVTKSETYKVDLSESDVKLEITNPKTDGSKIDSKSATLTRSGTAGNNYAISGYYYKLENTDKNEIVIQNSGNVTSFSKSDFSNGNYKLTVTMYYKNGTSNIKEKTEIRTFTVSIKSSGGWSGGGGGGSSGKSHKTNEIQLSTDTPNPSKNQGVNLTIKTNDYTGKLTFSAKYRPDTSSSRTDISNNTSSNYYGNYSNIWEEGYYTMKSSDDGEKKLKNLVEFQKEGYYRIYVTDDQGTTSYTEFHIGNTDEERYIARSCKKYKLTYNNSLSVRTSPNLNKNEYFVNTDYFKRYIDSKNAQIQGCPTNDPRISNTYQDTTNRDDKYTAPNGKVYFINNKNGKYQSDELDYPSKLFNTLSEIKYYIRDRNPFIGMAWTK